MHGPDRKSNDDEYPEENLRERHRAVFLTKTAENGMWPAHRAGNRVSLLGKNTMGQTVDGGGRKHTGSTKKSWLQVSPWMGELPARRF